MAARHYRKLALVLALAPLIILASCGTKGKADSAPAPVTTHNVPSWLLGNWKPLRLFWGEPVEDFDMIFTVSSLKMEYRYPGCYVSGRLVMRTDTPIYSANFYDMYMDNVNCPQIWDIPTFEGQTDFGKIWAEKDRSFMYRISDKYWEPVWIFVPQ
ncbi:MAG: hypothetical protein OEZ55_06260 [Nitrospinota bacterium]|nr:hypothetical protein [Nitrospinota bacterium]MDH5756252.1 hypothetical protein [Nitrospinota bacterium]